MTEIRFKELGLVEYSETYEAMMLLIESQPSFHSIRRSNIFLYLQLA